MVLHLTTNSIFLHIPADTLDPVRKHQIHIAVRGNISYVDQSSEKTR
jgi:hypothetical protein